MNEWSRDRERRSPNDRIQPVTVVPFAGNLDVSNYPVLTRVSAIDSTFLTELLVVGRHREDRGHATAIVVTAPSMLRLIASAGLTDRLRMGRTIAQARERLGERRVT